MCNMEVCKSHLNYSLGLFFNEGFIMGEKKHLLCFRPEFESNAVIRLIFSVEDHLWSVPKTQCCASCIIIHKPPDSQTKEAVKKLYLYCQFCSILLSLFIGRNKVFLS